MLGLLGFIGLILVGLLFVFGILFFALIPVVIVGVIGLFVAGILWLGGIMWLIISGVVSILRSLLHIFV